MLPSFIPYFKKYSIRPDRQKHEAVLSEFGGYNLRISKNCLSDRDFVYKRVNAADALPDALKKLYETEILPAKERGPSVAVYTQLTDVEDELNGLIIYDREIIKVPFTTLRHLLHNVLK